MTHLHAEAADHDGRNIDKGCPSAVWDGGGHHQRRRAACQHVNMLLVQSGELLLCSFWDSVSWSAVAGNDARTIGTKQGSRLFLPQRCLGQHIQADDCTVLVSISRTSAMPWHQQAPGSRNRNRDRYAPGGCTVRVSIMRKSATPTATGAATQDTLSGKMLRTTQPVSTETSCPPAEEQGLCLEAASNMTGWAAMRAEMALHVSASGTDAGAEGGTDALIRSFLLT